MHSCPFLLAHHLLKEWDKLGWKDEVAFTFPKFKQLFKWTALLSIYQIREFHVIWIHKQNKAAVRMNSLSDFTRFSNRCCLNEQLIKIHVIHNISVKFKWFSEQHSLIYLYSTLIIIWQIPLFSSLCHGSHSLRGFNSSKKLNLPEQLWAEQLHTFPWIFHQFSRRRRQVINRHIIWFTILVTNTCAA